MNDEDFNAWQTCWQANLLFYKVGPESQQCVLCSGVVSVATDTRGSAFWIEGTRCSAGHRQATQNELTTTPSFGLCTKCDHNYMFDLIQGKYNCRRQGCRRVVRINETEIRAKIQFDEQLLARFLHLVQKYSVFDCAIHGDEVQYDRNPAVACKPPSPECDHDRNVCGPCLQEMFERAIKGGRLDDLKCPDLECRKPVSLDTVRSSVSTEVFKTYNKQLALKTISKDEKFRWCSCGHGQIHGGGEINPEWNCLSCQKRHCYICRDDLSSSCEHLRAIDATKIKTKAQQRQAALRAFSTSAKRAQEAQFKARENEEGTRREIARTTKKCPKSGCGNKIQRNEGCGHFTCKKCSTQFCWACKVIWKGGTALHLTRCGIGTTRTISMASLDKTGYAMGWDKDEGYDLKLDNGLWLIDAHQ